MRPFRLLSILVGVLLAGVVLELALQVSSFVAQSQVLSQRSLGRDAERGRTVLCIGDSFTRGIGVKELESAYPTQLEKILNQRMPEHEWEVVNSGIPGWNSSQNLVALRRTLASSSPQFVCILAGLNDQGSRASVGEAKELLSQTNTTATSTGWTWRWRTAYLLKQLLRPHFHSPVLAEQEEKKADKRLPPNDGTVSAHMSEYWYWLARHNMGRAREALFSALSALRSEEDPLRFEIACGLRQVGAVSDAQKELERYLRHHPKDARPLTELAWAAFDAGDIDEAESRLAKVIAMNAGSSQTYCLEVLLARHYQDSTRAVRGVFKAIILGMGEGDVEYYLDLVLDESMVQRLTLDQVKEVIGELEEMCRTYGWNPKELLRLYAARLSAQHNVPLVLESNLKGMVDLCRQSGAEPLLITYPFWEPQQDLNAIISRVADKKGVAVVHPSLAFAKAQQEEAEVQLYGQDGHCSERGYWVLAQAVGDNLTQSFEHGEFGGGR
ncbi:MAG: hypothetical protein JW937_05770 [Candidatus Omnitrophica bacterium]|nr:hypothetical protein [Candidatus Omnitrophota bacterium]